MLMKGFFKGMFGFVILGVLFFVLGVHGDNVNVLTINPATYTGKYFCPLTGKVKIEYGGTSFSNCLYQLKFDTGDISVSYLSRGTDFDGSDIPGQIKNGLFTVAEKNDRGLINHDATCSVLEFVPINSLTSTTQIKFVDNEGNDPTDYTFSNTKGGLEVANNGSNTLTGVKNLILNFEACPCVLDSKVPVFTSFSHNFSPSSHYTGIQTIKFLVYDGGGSNWPYWTHGQKNFLNYDSVGVPSGMDNQQGVNSGTIKVTITYPGSTKVLTNGNGLTLTRYTGTIQNVPEYTWDGNDRGYWVTFTGNFDIETPVSINIEAYDNALSNGSVCTASSHKGTYNGTINQKEEPFIKSITPLNSAQNINPDSYIEIETYDKWAGIKTGSVKITIPTIYSGGSVLMTGYTYSGSDLSFQLVAGSSELGGASKYRIKFQPKYKFPTNMGIIVTGYVEDLVGMSKNLNSKFYTRADCSFYGCVNYVDIFLGDFDLGSLIVSEFTGSLIVVTGTISPYPYLTGDNGDILMCGPIESPIRLEGNIDIYSGTQVINGSNYLYSGLYISGMDFEYDPENGIITPIYR